MLSVEQEGSAEVAPEQPAAGKKAGPVPAPQKPAGIQPGLRSLGKGLCAGRGCRAHQVLHEPGLQEGLPSLLRSLSLTLREELEAARSAAACGEQMWIQEGRGVGGFESLPFQELLPLALPPRSAP